ncbi:Yip1-domain-containing protein [Hypoxylon cercidicola]|nr:Yip1-domain-containing protein [Hypoxylon cercidicola]
MSQYYGAPPPNQYAGGAAANLQFYPSSYSPGVPSQGAASQSYSYGAPPPGPAAYGGFGGAPGVSGRMGEQGGLRTGWLAAFSTEGYDGEPPLLEELGVNFGHIQMKTLAVLNPFGRIDQHIMDDSDLGGPIIFFLLFGTFLLLSGKVHFGYIYGLALMGSIALHTILSLMSTDSPGSPSPTPAYPSGPGYPGDPNVSGRDDPKGNLSSTLTFTRSASVLGYCLLPLVMTSLVGIALPMDGPLGYILTSAAIVWCTTSASGMFCAVGRMRQMRALVAYPLMLFYVGFGIMSIFSSRGSGSLGKAAGVS